MNFHILSSEGLIEARAKSYSEALRVQDALQRKTLKPHFVQPAR